MTAEQADAQPVERRRRRRLLIGVGGAGCLLGACAVFLLLFNWPAAVVTAAEDGRVGRLKLLLAIRPAAVNRAHDGRTPLGEAARSGRQELAEFLLTRGADVSAADGDGFTPLHYAASRGDAELASTLLKAGADPAAVTADGTPVLFLVPATDAGLAAVRVLLLGGADVDATDPGGGTLLYRAVEKNRSSLVRLLLGHRADPQAALPGSPAPVLLAAGAGRVEILDDLLDAGADASARGRDGRTAIERDWPAESYGVVRVLLEHFTPGDPARVFPVLTQALDRGDTELVRRYLREYHPVDQPSKLKRGGGRTLLHLAVAASRLGLVQMLLDRGASPNRRDQGDLTPLDLAVMDHPENTALFLPLLARGGDARIEHLYAAMSALLVGGHGEAVAAYLAGLPAIDRKRTRRGESLLHLAAGKGDIELARLLLAKGADVNAWTWQHRRPLHVAVTAPGNAREMTALLLEHQADANIPDLLKKTPLYIGVLMGAKPDVLKLLLDAGADVHVQCDEHYMPLHRAVMAGNYGVAKLLLQYKASPNEIDRDKKLPLHYAAQKGDKRLVQLLLDHGSWCRIKDNARKMPVHYAREAGREDIAKLILDTYEARKKRKKD